MYVYRVNGLSSDEPSRPVYDIAIMDYKMQLPNYFISYSPIEFLNRNNRLSDADKLRHVFWKILSDWLSNRKAFKTH